MTKEKKAPKAKTKEPKVKAPKKVVAKKAVAKKAPVKKKIPPCPMENETDGSKTPEVMAWYKKYLPKEYAVKYHAFELNREMET